jgi:hypothetical protein
MVAYRVDDLIHQTSSGTSLFESERAWELENSVASASCAVNSNASFHLSLVGLFEEAAYMHATIPCTPSPELAVLARSW